MPDDSISSVPAGPPIVGFANRLPVVRAKEGWRPADGGLVTALRPVLEARGASWVGWTGATDSPPERIEDLAIDLHPVPLSPRQVAGYYHGFSNRTLWPLLHDVIENPVFDAKWWRAYEEVNRRFATSWKPGPKTSKAILWVHDYHLMLLPQMLRERGGDNRISYFLHTPFPASELFARLPWRSRLLQGMLGADIVAFHTELYRENFGRACQQILDDVKVLDDRILLPDGRAVRTSVHPISIDARDFHASALDEEAQRELGKMRSQFRDRRVLLGVDRLDYSKGIFEKLRAFERFIERRPDLQGRTTLLQVAVPSRGEVKEYRELRAHVEREVGRINGRFTEAGHEVPIRYLYRSLPRNRLVAYYQLADVGLVTPLKDGMNLVAKEFVVCQAAGDSCGALVLSEFAGAARELAAGAIVCNPFDVEGFSAAMEVALDMSEGERRRRIEEMSETVHRNDVFAWAESILSEAEAS